MILEDVIMLARTVPEPSKKYGVRVCSVVYSPELRQLLRIYPIMTNEVIKQRYCFRVKLERNEKDSRKESFKKIAYSLTGEVVSKSKLKPILEDLIIDDISTLNEEKKSLGVIKCESGTYFMSMKSKKDIPDPDQMCLFQAPNLNSQKIITGRDYKHIPYVTIPNQKKQKNIQLREWGIYELIRKNNGIISDSYLSDIFKNNDVFFIIGNMNGCRSIWIACSFYTYKNKQQLEMF